jgi:hypothetical protein
VSEVLASSGAVLTGDDPLRIGLDEVPPALRDALGDQRDEKQLRVRFELPVSDGVLHLHRTHPLVSGLAGHVLDTALDPALAHLAVARRSGVVRTRDVKKRTTAVLLRLRYHILTPGTPGNERALLAEDCRLVAFRGSAEEPEWLTEGDAEALLTAEPSANVPADQARHFLQRLLDDLPTLAAAFEKTAHDHAARLLDAHERVREALKGRGGRHRVEPKLPVDVLGAYVYLPEGAA